MAHLRDHLRSAWEQAFPAVLTAALLSVGASSTAMAIEPGDVAPEFTSKNYSSKPVKLSDYKGKTVVLEWFNPGCPFVLKHYHSHHMQKMQADAAKEGVVWLSVNSTNPDHRDFLTPDKAEAFRKEQEVASTEILEDGSGSVGKLYDAKTTPQMFIIDKDGKIAYAGAIDDQADTDGDPNTAKNYVSLALQDLREGKKVGTASTEPYGCSIKYAR